MTRCQHAFPELEEAVKRLQERLADLLLEGREQSMLMPVEV